MFCIFILAAAYPGETAAATNRGVHFEDEMTLDGEVLGKVAGEEFASAYMSIWLGPKPVSRDLQEGLFDPATRME